MIDNRKNYSSSQSNIVTCPVCYETVAGQRFAPHLEKCLNGGKRGGLPSKKASGAGCSTNNMGIGLPYYSQIKKVDPYPLSLIVRIRLKDGCKNIIYVVFLSICLLFFFSFFFYCYLRNPLPCVKKISYFLDHPLLLFLYLSVFLNLNYSTQEESSKRGRTII